MRRFFDPQLFTKGQPATLGEDASHHISRVLRMKEGDQLQVFNGEGGAWQAQITALSRKAVTVLPASFDSENRLPPRPVTVALPLIKGERMDYALQKATELGAHQFQLLNTERTDVRLDGERLEKKLRHWQQVVISACEQCGMNLVPIVLAPQPLADWLPTADAGLKLIAHPGENPLPADACHGVADIILLTGPEGGFSEAEISAATEQGFVSFALGNRILRAETAPVALLAALWARISS
ncbi:16S rRNA (uracil(1498)-N(3))-methyltransferase [Alcanivorax quisquiliarum]|uniref:Ribosomal RNA small subunit methyltransferase E n=1 Tax=Alcanivorax quisquiliarum TaxID=2933565 RepID=A0ABT0E4S9_9GAMM|nr:16S rRNA (uracil(1498)-N(3))-methyltransferase [Alcanivorax quisquiliarum]MCK0536814.1 16S rRNA (uracil(1498)-N(3))-methyltransferase [Alcanivorax quisquiliarum]